MSYFLGCLFTLLFSVILIIFGFVNYILRLFNIDISSLFKGYQKKATRQSQGRYNQTYEQNTSNTETRAGNAHHEEGYRNTQQRQNNKIFEKNEGEYVDFEEV